MSAAPKLREYIPIERVAQIFGYSVTWIYQHRAELEKRGFPPPAMGHGKRSMRWDPHAIALWQDSQIPAELRDANAVRIEGAAARIDLAGILDARAEELAGGGRKH